MINTEKLEIIISKRNDRTPALLEVFRLSGSLAGIADDKFDVAVNAALDKVLNLLFLQAQSKKATGYVLTKADYKALGIYERHIKKLRRNSKKSLKESKLLRVMPKIYEIKKKKNLTFRELKKYIAKRYKINVSHSYLYKIFKNIFNISYPKR